MDNKNNLPNKRQFSATPPQQCKCAPAKPAANAPAKPAANMPVKPAENMPAKPVANAFTKPAAAAPDYRNLPRVPIMPTGSAAAVQPLPQGAPGAERPQSQGWATYVAPASSMPSGDFELEARYACAPLLRALSERGCLDGIPGLSREERAMPSSGFALDEQYACDPLLQAAYERGCLDGIISPAAAWVPPVTPPLPWQTEFLAATAPTAGVEETREEVVFVPDQTMLQTVTETPAAVVFSGCPSPIPGSLAEEQAVATAGRCPQYGGCMAEVGRPVTMCSLLQESIGHYIITDHLVGTGSLVHQEGFLTRVESNCFVLYDDISNSFIVCDYFSLKFFRRLMANERPELVTTGPDGGLRLRRTCGMQ